MADFKIKSLNNRKADCWDDALNKSVWGKLKIERIYGKRYDGLSDWLEKFLQLKKDRNKN